MLISGRESSPAGSCRVKGWFEDFSNMYTLKGKSQIVIQQFFIYLDLFLFTLGFRGVTMHMFHRYMLKFARNGWSKSFSTRW